MLVCAAVPGWSEFAPEAAEPGGPDNPAGRFDPAGCMALAAVAGARREAPAAAGCAAAFVFTMPVAGRVPLAASSRDVTGLVGGTFSVAARGWIGLPGADG